MSDVFYVDLRRFVRHFHHYAISNLTRWLQGTVYVRASPLVRVPTRVYAIYTGRKKKREPPGRVWESWPDTGGVKTLSDRENTLDLQVL